MSSRRDLLDQLTHRLLDRPRFTAAALGVIGLFCVAMLPRLTFSDSLEDFMDRTLPSQGILEQLEENFTSERWMFIAYETSDVFSADALRTTKKLSDEIVAMTIAPKDKEAYRPFDDVVSLTTINDVYGKDGGLEVRPLVPTPVPDDLEALEVIEQRGRKNPVISDQLISEASDKVGGIVVRVKREAVDKDTRMAVTHLRKILDRTEEETKDFKIHLTGHPVVETDFPELLLRDVLVMTPVLFVLIVSLLFFLLRKLAGVVMVIGFINLGTMVGVAMVPATGSVYNGLYGSMPPLLMVLCVAISLHFLCEAGRHMETFPGEDPRRPVMRSLIRPVLMSCVTTAIGFITLSFTNITAIREYGTGLSLAIFACGVVALFYVGFIWSRWPAERFISPKAFVLSPGVSRVLSSLADMAIRNAAVVVLACTVVAGLGLWGASKLVVSESAIEYFPEDHPVREGAMFFEPHLGGSSPLIVSIRTEEPERLLDPVELQKIASLESFLLEETPIDRTGSIATIMKVSYRAFFNEDDSKFMLPETKAQSAQLLLLNSDDRVEQFIDPAHMWARIVTRMPVHRTVEQRAVYDNVHSYLEKSFPKSEGYDARLTSDHLVFAESTGNNNRTLFLSLSSSVALIFLLFVVLFRSLRVALFSMVPNAFPVVTAMGILGWFTGELTVTTAAVAAILLGIAIDDTVHFIDAYRRRLSVHGNIEKALRETLYTKGPAITFTSVLFTIGFTTFLLADFLPLGFLGTYLAIGMVAAFVGDVLFLPALISLTGARLGVPKQAAADTEEAPQ